MQPNDDRWREFDHQLVAGFERRSRERGCPLQDGAVSHGSRIMAIKLKRVYEPSSREDGYRVLVDRLWPRGVSKETAHIDLWLRDIAPTSDLRKWFAHEPDKWPEFQKRYRRELGERAPLLAMLRDAEREHGTVTLLFGARDTERNQAQVIAAVLEGERRRVRRE